jgi:TetR/AcrR family acrAB operon transcriptional repressor
LFRVLEECAVVRDVFAIMISRCAYVDECASVPEEVGRPAREFLRPMKGVDQRAADKGMLRDGLAPLECAWDTGAFTSGMLHPLLGGQMNQVLDQEIPRMISCHRAACCCP